ncbi:metal ABC transporter solute-binding protein, Zn/Mn family [Ferrimonas senticii]|uniref:metal ABC transporter solute-binding protein, Zn/Mn family n=1 Tax=Ferrimonas senticii TaxID=394566 RepID=UPI00041AAC4A|nr:zinc ABC transporter substrate-binding protein [Ferrimonas senticii]
MPINSNQSQWLRGWIRAALISAAAWLPLSAQALNIFACEPEYAALAKALAPNAEVFSATSAMQDPHHVQARPSLIAKLRNADLAICAGAELEVGWLPMLQMKANNPQVRDGKPGMLYAADYVEAIGKLDQIDRTMGDVHASGNPHFHFSPTRIAQIAAAISDRLILLDGANADHYRQQQQQFRDRWQAAQQRWQQQAAPLAGIKVIAYHSNFAYLFDWLGIEQIGDLEPKPGLPPTTSHLSQLLALSKQQTVTAVIYNGYQDPRGVDWLSQRTGIPAVRLPYGPGVDGIDDLAALYDRVIADLLALL